MKNLDSLNYVSFSYVLSMAYVILVSAQGPNPFFSFFGGLLFDLGAYWDQDLDQGLTIISLICRNPGLLVGIREIIQTP